MRPMLIVVMLFIGVVSAFGIDNNEVIAADNQPVITGGRREIDVAELDNGIASFAGDYLENNLDAFTTYAAHKLTLVVERVWLQLVQGRRYLLGFYLMSMPQKINEDNPLTDVFLPIPGLLMLRRGIDGVITLEKVYDHFNLFDFIELMLTGENIYDGVEEEML